VRTTVAEKEMSKYYPLSGEHHIIWNKMHPEDMIVKGDGCLIHHIDGNHFNNNPNNLKKMTWEAHSSLHNKGKRYSKNTRNKISISRKIFWKNASPDFKRKFSDVRKGRIPSKETRTKISEAGKLRKHTVKDKQKISEANRLFYNTPKGKMIQSERARVGWIKRRQQYAN
jgi:hypothetical protein